MFAYCYNSPVCLADYTGEDAIYVAVTDLNGLPVVGHAVLFIQDANGKWYMTEYAGKNKNDASVQISPASDEMILKTIVSNKKNWVYIPGDFSASYELAQQYCGTNYGGYNLLVNNCLHYVREILRAGTPDSFLYTLAFECSTIIPVRFCKNLKSFQKVKIMMTIREVVNSIPKKASEYIAIGVATAKVSMKED